MKRKWLALGLVVGALCFVAPAFGNGTDWYALNVSYSQGQIRSSSYDTCAAQYPGLIYASYFGKGSSNYGTTMFIDNTIYSWHRQVSGYGALNTTEPNYTSYHKKAASDNNGSSGSYTASGEAFWISATCT